MTLRIDVLIEDRRWKACRGLSRELDKAARLALRRGGCRKRNVSLTILLAGDAKLRELNHVFRGKKKPTNVLSFNSTGEENGHLGDIAIAYGVTAREARAGGKPLGDHATHLAVHGVLHLLGFDHVTARLAAKMEPLETRVLAELGIPDPYAAGAKPA